MATGLRRLLVANRGEIAVRVMRTARRLGIATIAVHSDADAHALHVRSADEAWRLGPPAPRESYLSIERIIEVARRAGADAIHPGYGFLSERADFAAACEAAGIMFVGPPAAAIEAMGSKSAAKEAMHRAGVPVLPGYHGAEQSTARLVAEAGRVGFPLIIKPSGGGGGKGMQIVTQASELEAAVESARRLASSAFGDPELLLERYLPSPRHVEVQLIADGAGMIRCLATRDCSVQRRHQKLIEEAPAPGIAPEVRGRLHEAARTVARAVGYRSAGTVEFLYSDGEFWFMEMNTRLQVEHTVTEEVLGLDLVEWQLRIAVGESLPAGPDPAPSGHAIEVRICAEDAAAGFTPSAGTLGTVHWPRGLPGVRVDAGFEAGDVVPPNYDSLLAKVIAHGATRPEAIARLRAGLAALRVDGVATNTAWLDAALACPGFAEGAPTTRFVADHGAALGAAAAATRDERVAAALAWLLAPAPRDGTPWAANDAFRLGLPWRQELVLDEGERRHAFTIERSGDAWRVCDGPGEGAGKGEGEWQGTARWLGTGLELKGGGRATRHDIAIGADRISLWRGALRLGFQVHDPRQVDAGSGTHEGELVAKLPGTIVSVGVAVGDMVRAGQTLMVIEAMKMEHAIMAPHAGRVTAIRHRAGERVAEGAVLAELDAAVAPAGEGG